MMAFDLVLAACGTSAKHAAASHVGKRPPIRAVDRPAVRDARRSRRSTRPGRWRSCPDRPRRSSPRSRAASGWSTSRTGRKQPVGGAPRVVRQRPGRPARCRGCRPTFACDSLVYLTYAEPSANGGSGLALARAQLVRDAAARGCRTCRCCGTTRQAARAASSARSSPSRPTANRCS